MPTLTDDLIRREPLAAAGQRIVRDDKLRGFFVVVGARSKTFTVQIDVPQRLGKARTVKRAIGRFPDMSTRDARRAAEAAIVEIRAGAAPPANAETLADAWRRLRASLEARVAAGERSGRTVQSYQYGFELLADWHREPMRALFAEGGAVADRFADLTRNHGPSAANAAMVFLRRVYRDARRRDRTLPSGHPAEAVHLNPARRKEQAMSAADLQHWAVQLAKLPNRVRAEFHLFGLLSGSRPGALAEARWEHIDRKRRALHIPRPKGGERRAFDIPLSREMVRCLCRVRRVGQRVAPGSPWIFPAPGSETGHVAEWREDRRELSHWGHDLRRTWATLANEAGLSKMDRMILLNHAAGDVSDGYVVRSAAAEGYLRAQQQRLSTYIARAMRASSNASSLPQPRPTR